jgi:hypothetical protein
MPQGFSPLAGLIDRLQHRFKIIVHVGVPKPYHQPSMVRQIPGSFRVGLFSADMCLTINLDDQLAFMTCQVGKERTDRALTSKLEARKCAVAEVFPQDHLGRRHLPPELASPIASVGIRRHGGFLTPGKIVGLCKDNPLTPAPLPRVQGRGEPMGYLPCPELEAPARARQQRHDSSLTRARSWVSARTSRSPPPLSLEYRGADGLLALPVAQRIRPSSASSRPISASVPTVMRRPSP